VHAQRIRRLCRTINPTRFSTELSNIKRLELRAALGLPETDFIFLHLGPLEVESGAMDVVYSFKNLLQSHPEFENNARLCFCGKGSAGADIRQTVVEMGLDAHVYFLNPVGEDVPDMMGNQFSHVLSICDAVIHVPIAPINGSPLKHLDSTYDILCALSSGLLVVSNGSGFIGEWVGRYYKTCSPGNIHSLARLMQETIAKQDVVSSVKAAVKKGLANEFPFTKTINDMVGVLKDLIQNQSAHIVQNAESNSKLIEQIEQMIKGRQYLDAIECISQAFTKKDLSTLQQASLFRLIGDCFTKLGDLDNGSDNYLRAVDLDPYCARSFIGLGTVALQRQDFNVAVPQFQKSITLAPNDDMASLGLGLAFEGLGEQREALRWTMRACHLNPDSTVALFQLVKLAYDLNEYSEAEKALTRYVGRHPHDIHMIYSLGGIYYQTEQWDSALRLMDNILALDPTNNQALTLIAQIHKQQMPHQQQA